MSVSETEKVLHELNGFLQGIAVMSDMFLKSGACRFEFKRLSPDFNGGKMLKPVDREDLAFELDRWFSYGMSSWMSTPEHKMAAAYHREIEEAAKQARDRFFARIESDIFRKRKWEILYAEEKIEDQQSLQDEYLFRCNGEMYYLRLGWSE